MRKSDFSFDLPPELIAQHPAPVRGDDRLLVLHRGAGGITHSRVSLLPSFLEPGTVLVFNNTRVRKARVYGECFPPGRKSFRGELLFIGEPPEGDTHDARRDGLRWRIMLRGAKKISPGTRFVFDDGREASALENPALGGTEFRDIAFAAPVTEDWFEKTGHVPLPPYIRRADADEDIERYQTVYARETGSVASPTAGLHFTADLLARLSDLGFQTEWVTLHVGPGTFLPLREETVEDHVMHEEWYTVPPETAARLNAARHEGRRILAVGTTSARTLESAWRPQGGLRGGSGSTSLFIYPGYTFHVVDSLFTNFHTPESTLLLLVCALAGKERIFAAYREAVERRYRFFSYGDAMLITGAPQGDFQNSEKSFRHD